MMSDISRPTGGAVATLTRVNQLMTFTWRFKLDKLPLQPRLLVRRVDAQEVVIGRSRVLLVEFGMPAESLVMSC